MGTLAPTAAPTGVPTTIEELLYGRDTPTKYPTDAPTLSKRAKIVRTLAKSAPILKAKKQLEGVAVRLYRRHWKDPVPSDGVDGLPADWQARVPTFSKKAIYGG